MTIDPRAVADTYRRSSIESAPPAKVVRLLYEGALRFLAHAATCDPADPASDFVEYCGRVDSIVTELRLALDHGLGDEVTENLERLYLFCEDELGRATFHRDIEPLDGVKRVLETLLDGWRYVEREAGQAA